MTEDQIERIYERTMDLLDERLLDGSLKPKAYEAESWKLYEWSMKKYKELENGP